MINQAPEIAAEGFDDSSVILPPTRKELIKVIALGAVIGLLIPLISFLIERFFIEPVFCRSADSFGVCSTGGLTAYYAATVILSIVGVVLLANWQVFRPLLIAVAAAAALWGFKKYTGELSIHSVMEYYITSMLLFAVVYILFYWTMRIRNFAISVIVAVVLVALIRWALLV